MVKIDIQGIDALKKQIRELNGNLHKASLAGLRKGGSIVAKKANETAKSKGYSQKKYFTVLREAKSLKKSEGSAGVVVGTKVIKGLTAPKKNRVKYYKENGDYFYMRFVEFGTVSQNRQNIVSDAIKSEEAKVADSVNESLNNMISKLSGPLEGKK